MLPDSVVVGRRTDDVRARRFASSLNQRSRCPVGKNQNTFEKRRREHEKKQKAEEKRKRREDLRTSPTKSPSNGHQQPPSLRGTSNLVIEIESVMH